ncbi:hypothetical protein CAEBREN_13184 [Caenorhabditis brenneri]|uniref:Uncharacterized protein n=1 Tax=Caenorhabditis brenneri TaxID=135651 RepID=G0NDE3_CAEBE|nr:hypothetical protein CAEBREN_13184 [Caenorhabditis brenneri]
MPKNQPTPSTGTPEKSAKREHGAQRFDEIYDTDIEDVAHMKQQKMPRMSFASQVLRNGNRLPTTDSGLSGNGSTSDNQNGDSTGQQDTEDILNSLRMDECHGLTDNNLLEEIEKAKKYIASDDINWFSNRLRVLKATRTAVTEQLWSQAKQNFKLTKVENNVIISYEKMIYGNGDPLKSPTPKSNIAEEGSVSSTSVCDAQCSTSGMIETPVPSPAQNSLTELSVSNNSVTAEETLRTVTTIPWHRFKLTKFLPHLQPSHQGVQKKQNLPRELEALQNQ